MSMLQLEVVTPDKTVVSAQVEMAVCPGVMGEFGVLPHHVSLLSALKIGNLRYTEGGKQHNVFISGRLCRCEQQGPDRAGGIGRTGRRYRHRPRPGRQGSRRKAPGQPGR